MSVIKDWTAALRSGEYEQCRTTLKDKDGFCCLGVATDKAIKEAVVSGTWEVDSNGGWYYQDPDIEEYKESAALPSGVSLWLGTIHGNPAIRILFVEPDAYLDAFGDWKFEIDGEEGRSLPSTSEQWRRSEHPSLFRQEFTLAELNDTGFTFEQIADVIDYFFEDGPVEFDTYGHEKTNPNYSTLEFQATTDKELGL